MFHPHNQPPASDHSALQFVFQRGKLVSDMRARVPCLLERERVLGLGWQIQREQFLGFWHDRPCYVVEIKEAQQLDPMQYQCGALIQMLGRVDDQLFALAGRAQQLLDWERDHCFCGRCGQPMALDAGERAMRCEPCGVINYPRIAPCVIVLVTRGDEMLLARNVNFPGPMYSTLAGFIEAGENAEECIHREVKEEVGLDVGQLRYFDSQSWPFPNQLMLGFYAEYAGGDIVCAPDEIADAQWFHHSQLPQIPPPGAIAGQLIRQHIAAL